MSIESVELYSKQYGQGPPLLILHGLLGAGGNWHSLSRNVFGNEFTVHAVDLRNHGRSPHSDRFDIASMVADVVRYYEAHGLSDAYVMGHSMGGKVAMQLALDDPGLVTRLIVVDVAPKAYPPSHQELLDALQDLDLESASSRSDIDAALAERISSYPVRQFLLKNLAYDSDTGRYSWQMGLESIRNNYGKVNEPVDSARTYDGPALFIRGEKSNYIRNGDMDDIRSLFPKARLETVPDAGHWIHADAPDAFAQIVVDFLYE